jgi:NitT/TauT family transport system substrate-binding protein
MKINLKFKKLTYMKKYVLTLFSIVFVLTIITLVSCKSEREKVKVGYIPIADAGQLFVALENKYFEENDLEVDLVKMQGGSKILEASINGSIDIGFSNLVSVILANNSGINIIPITGGPFEDSDHKVHAILVRTNGKINSPTDLAGKTIAVNTKKNIAHLFAITYLKKYNVNVDSVNFIEAPFPQLEALLASNRADAIVSIEPFVSNAISQEEKYKVLSYVMMDITPKVEIAAYNANEAWVASNKDKVEKFQNAIAKSTKFIKEHPDKAKVIISKYTGISPEIIQSISLPNYSEKVSEEGLTTLKNLMVEEGWIKNDFDIKSMMSD